MRGRKQEPMGDLDRQRRLADAANALERRDPLSLARASLRDRPTKGVWRIRFGVC